MLLQPSYHRLEGTDGAAEAQGDSAAGDSVCGPRSRSLFEQQVEHQPPGPFGQSQVTPGGRLNARDVCTQAFAHTRVIV